MTLQWQITKGITCILYMYSNTYQIPVSPQNVKWILAQSEGEIVFDHACDLGFHSSALLNGPGALGAREECAAECS